MVSEPAGEGAMPPQLPTPARRLLKIVELRNCLRQPIRRGSSVRRRYPPTSQVLSHNNSILRSSAVQSWKLGIDLAEPRVLLCADAMINFILKNDINQYMELKFVYTSFISDGDDISRSAIFKDRSLSKVLIGPLFVVFDRTSWNRSMKSWSRVLINRSSRSRFAERSSAELVNLPFDSLCVQSLIVNPLLIAFNCSSRSRSVESTSTTLVVDSVCVGRLPAIPIPNSAMVSRSQSVNFDVVVSTQPSSIHFNSNSKKASEWPRKGSRRRIGESADLCDRFSSVHKEEKFCEIFHLNVSGGIECIICARKSCILTPNLAWPPPSDFLPLQAEGIKDSRSWNPIAGSGPVPSREVQCLNSPFIGQQLQALVIKSSLILDVLVGCSDLDMYSKMSIKEIADNVFEEMPNRKRHWGMHSVDFYNCWNEYQQESSTQIFILSDKPNDANLILVGFRGTESLDVDDWSFADQDIDGRALMLFLLKHKGSNQINFEIGWPCYCWSSNIKHRCCLSGRNFC
nr:B3 domain-containing protein Os07g0563300 isoform X1 [Ipomoea batatas]